MRTADAMPDERDDDQLLQDLAAVAWEEEAREAALLDERWDRLAQGELDTEEVARLAAEAERSEEELRRFESFRPLPASFRAQVASRILEELGAASRPVPPALRFEPRPPRKGFGGLGWRLAALAAALALAALLGPRLMVPRFPAYELSLLPAGVSTERSLEPAAQEAPALFHPGTAFEVAARPLAEIEDLHGALEVRCLLQGGPDGGRLRLWPSCAERAEVAPTQAVRVAGTLGRDLTLEPGTWTLWLVLGRRGKIADFEGHPSLLTGPVVAKRNWTALRVPRPLRMEPLP